uniref:Uncharacterized protein n=1 Tax=Trichogramma kaykai TaxID=54128 RepID=A0ABD2XAJ7_9HYME
MVRVSDQPIVAKQRHREVPWSSSTGINDNRRQAIGETPEIRGDVLDAGPATLSKRLLLRRSTRGRRKSRQQPPTASLRSTGFLFLQYPLPLRFLQCRRSGS